MGPGGAGGRSAALSSKHSTYWIVGLGVAYFFAHQAAFLFPDSGKVLMAIWPAGGLGLAALLLSPRCLWPAIIATLFVAGNLANLLEGRPLLASLGFMTGNVLESLAGGWLIRATCGEGTSFRRVREVLALLGVALFVNAATATVGAGTARLAGSAPFWSAWATWWTADGLGILLMAPLLVSWAAPGEAASGWRRRVEEVTFLILWCALAWLAFNASQVPWLPPLPPYIVGALLAWPALRFGPRGMTSALALLALITVTSTSVVAGPLMWGGADAVARLLLAQCFVAVLTVTGLLLAATHAEATSAATAAAEGEARLRAMGDNLPDGMVYQVVRELDGSMRFLHVSAGVGRMHGLSIEEVLRDPSTLYGRIVEEDREMVAAAEHESAWTLTAFRAVARVRRSDAEVRWMRFSSSPRRLPDGRILWDGIQMDITDRMQAKERLERINACLLALGPDFDTNVNRLTSLCGSLLGATCALYNRLEAGQLCPIGQWHVPPGYLPLEESAGSICHDVIRRGVDEPTVVSNLQETSYAVTDANVARFGLNTYLGHVVRCASEPVGVLCVWFQEEAAPTDDDRRIIGIIASALCGEEGRRRAESALRESEERFAKVFRHAPVLLSVTDLATEAYVEVNEEALRVSGYTRAEVIGHTAREVGWLADEDRERLSQEVRAHGRATDLEMALRAKDGRRLVGRVDGEQIVIAGRPCLLTITVDVTERRRAEEGRAKAEAKLQQSLKMESIGRLAGGVAHDFNNMLGIILNYAELAKQQVDPSQQVRDDLEEICTAARRSADLTRQLLAFARKQVIAPRALDLNVTVAGMLEMLRRLVGEDIEFTWRPGDGLWPVLVDPSQIDQILANLCINARDAIAGVGRISIGTENRVIGQADCAQYAGLEPGDFVSLAVSDDGCGMAQDAVAHVFEPFFSTKGQGKGTGLGLATVYGIVKQNAGFISVVTGAGTGTTFTLLLPRHEGKVLLAHPEAGLAADQRAHETVLLVEDEQGLLRLTKRLLERKGYTVVPAGAPSEALRLAREHRGPLHLLVTDVIMPGMNGRELAKNVLSSFPHVKCLFMSGYTADIIAHRGVLDEGVSFIQKPFSSGDFLATVRRVLDGESESCSYAKPEEREKGSPPGLEPAN